MSEYPPGLAGLRVVAFESRMAEPMAELIRKHGGVPFVAPSLREVPVDDNPAAFDLARALMDNQVDLAIFLTGVGTRYLAQAIETRIPREMWVAELNRAEIVARGPKPVAALRELGVRVDLQVPEPNTWNELLAALDARRDLHGVRVAVQEYGVPNPDLIAGLESRGAVVQRVPIYRWDLPEDTGPLRQAAHDLAERRAGAALFTSAQQVVHLLQIATEEGVLAPLRQACAKHLVIGSIGPTTSEALREHGLDPDIEPEHPKMGHLAAALAQRWRGAAKAAARQTPTLPAEAAANPAATADPLHSCRFLKACRREPVDATPIWLMRQAGRYMAEYRELRAKVSFLDLCKRPELATEVTVTAAERLGVDAAILFADILLVLEPLGFDLEFSKGEGPIIHNPVRQSADVDRLIPLVDNAPLAYVPDAVRMIRAALPAHVPLIGFSGAPFTLACYCIEGGSSRHYDKAKRLLYNDPGAWHALLERLTDALIIYLSAQIEAGADAIQVFDSWVGHLGPDDYREFVQPHMKRLFQALPSTVPLIHFGTETAALLELQRDAGGSVIGLDWRVRLDDAWQRLGPDVAVQGNLDPTVLLAPIPEIERQARRILDYAAGRPGHIFNLGHGILPMTPVDHVKALVDFVHQYRPSP